MHSRLQFYTARQGLVKCDVNKIVAGVIKLARRAAGGGAEYSARIELKRCEVVGMDIRRVYDAAHVCGKARIPRRRHSLPREDPRKEIASVGRVGVGVGVVECELNA